MAGPRSSPPVIRQMSEQKAKIPFSKAKPHQKLVSTNHQPSIHPSLPTVLCKLLRRQTQKGRKKGKRKNRSKVLFLRR